MTPLLIDGPSDAAFTVVFAHGAGAGMEHEGMAVLMQIRNPEEGYKKKIFDPHYLRETSSMYLG